MRKFIIKSAQFNRKSGDPFGFTEATEHIYCYAAGLKDLRNIIRFITPRGYGVHSHRWFSKYTGKDVLVIINPLLLTVLHEIREIDYTPEIEKEIECQNTSGKKHKLKLINPRVWTNQN